MQFIAVSNLNTEQRKMDLGGGANGEYPVPLSDEVLRSGSKNNQEAINRKYLNKL